MSPRPGLLWLALALAFPACAQALPVEPADPAPPAAATTLVPSPAPSAAWTGRQVYDRFRTGLAEPDCDDAATSARWRTHFAHAPRQLGMHDGDVLPLFGYVVEALREAQLPTEYALIPFVESGYRPGARSPQGPAGLWQMIAITARNHQVAIRPGYDGRLSPVDSTGAAVRYLRKLHGMFGGNWRLAVMAYNAGEYRVLGAIRRSGKTVATAKADALPGLSPITQAYVRKLHALSCLMDRAYERGDWAGSQDKPLPHLEAVSLPASAKDIAGWARATGQDPERLQRLNPAFVQGRIARVDGKPARLLAFAEGGQPPAPAVAMGTAEASPATTQALARVDDAPPSAAEAASPPVAAFAPAVEAGAGDLTAPTAAAVARRHTVLRGDSLSRIAARYGIRVADLLSRNHLDARSVLHPGAVLLIDAQVIAGTPAAGTR